MDRLQNESQQMFALCDQREEEQGYMIGQNPKAEVAPFLSAEIGIKKAVLKRDVAVNRWGESRAKTPGEEAERILDKKNLCF